MELIESSLENYFGVWKESCGIWPLNLPKVWIKTSKRDFWGLFEFGTLESFEISQKNHCFLWDNGMHMETASSSSSFHLLQCLLDLLLLTAARRWHIIKLCMEPQDFYFPLHSQNEKNKYLCWHVIYCTVHCWSVDVQSATPENRTTLCNSCAFNTKGSSKPRNLRFETPDS